METNQEHKQCAQEAIAKSESSYVPAEFLNQGRHFMIFHVLFFSLVEPNNALQKSKSLSKTMLYSSNCIDECVRDFMLHDQEVLWRNELS